MFRQLAREYAKDQPYEPFPPPEPFPLPEESTAPLPFSGPKFSELFLYHPIQLAGLMEAAWEARFLPVREGDAVSPITGLPQPLLNLFAVAGPYEGEYPYTFLRRNIFDHLIYAYMIENTRIYEIFRRVLNEYLHGERFEVPSQESQRWLQNTEELFYRDTPSFLAFRLTSYIRPDIRASRRNAYYRMFGMDLDFGADDGSPYSYAKPDAANRDFVKVFEEFLREVWRGIINFTNTSGPNATDNSAIANHAESLSDMMNVRRRNGNLSREEFFFVATMSWLHLTVEANLPIVKDLKADTTSSTDTLRKIGERVGLPPHAKAHDFFSLAKRMSRLLIVIESGIFNDPNNVRPLYATNSPLRNDMEQIITSWSSATGRNMKAEPVTASPARALSPAAALVPVSSTNSASPVPASRS